MAELELNLGPSMRKAMISGLADLVDATPSYRFGVILELLRRDATSRCMIAEALGERTIREHQADMEAARIYDANKGEGCEPPTGKSWDEIMLEVLAELQDTPVDAAKCDEDPIEGWGGLFEVLDDEDARYFRQARLNKDRRCRSTSHSSMRKRLMGTI